MLRGCSIYRAGSGSRTHDVCARADGVGGRAGRLDPLDARCGSPVGGGGSGGGGGVGWDDGGLPLDPFFADFHNADMVSDEETHPHLSALRSDVFGVAGIAAAGGHGGVPAHAVPSSGSTSPASHGRPSLSLSRLRVTAAAGDFALAPVLAPMPSPVAVSCPSPSAAGVCRAGVSCPALHERTSMLKEVCVCERLRVSVRVLRCECARD